MSAKNPTTHTHRILTSKRVWTVTSTELYDRIALTMEASKLGRLGDEPELEKPLFAIVDKYKDLGLPITMTTNGVVMVCTKTPAGRWLWISPGPDLAPGAPGVN